MAVKTLPSGELLELQTSGFRTLPDGTGLLVESSAGAALTINSTIDDVVSSLSFSVSPQLTIATTLDAVTSALSFAASSPASLTISSVLDEVASSLSFSVSPQLYIANTLADVTSALRFSETQEQFTAGGGAGYPVFVKPHKPRKTISDIIEKAVDEQVKELSGAYKAIKQTRDKKIIKQAAKVVKPFSATKASTPLTDNVDWNRLAEEKEIIKQLLNIYNDHVAQQQEQLLIDEMEAIELVMNYERMIVLSAIQQMRI